MRFNEEEAIYNAEKDFLKNEYIRNLIDANVITERQARGHLFLFCKSRKIKKVDTKVVAFELMQVIMNENKAKKHYANLSTIHREFARFYCHNNSRRNNSLDFIDHLKSSSQAQLDCLNEQKVKELTIVTTPDSCNACKDAFNKGDKITITQAMREKVLPYKNCKKNCNRRLLYFVNEKICTCEYDSKEVDKKELKSPALDDKSLFEKISSDKKLLREVEIFLILKRRYV